MKKVKNCCSAPQVLVRFSFFELFFFFTCTDFCLGLRDKACLLLDPQKPGPEHGRERECGGWEARAPEVPRREGVGGT